MSPEPRVLTIEGRRVLVKERNPPIPPTLQLMLEGGRDSSGFLWSPLRITRREHLRLGGARTACAMQDHRLKLWLEGVFLDRDRLVRSLSLQSCADCGAVCVRDVSFDTLAAQVGPGHELKNPPVSRPLRRRDGIVGWYSGGRPLQRVYT